MWEPRRLTTLWGLHGLLEEQLYLRKDDTENYVPEMKIIKLRIHWPGHVARKEVLDDDVL
jgi:hypothetical protein